MDPFFSSSPLPPLPNFPPPILNMDETPSPASADVTSNLSPIFSLLKSGWSADETSTWVDKLHNLLRKNRIFVPQDLLLFKDKAMQAVYIAITGEMEFQVIDHVKWNRLLASIPPLASAAAPLTAVHLIRETTIKPTAATVAPAQLQPVTRDAFVKRLIDFCPLLPTIADYIRDLLLIRDESTLGFNLRPQTHFYHQSGAEFVNFRCVCGSSYKLQVRKGGNVELSQLTRHITEHHMELRKPLASPAAENKKRERETQTVLTAASFTRSPTIIARPPHMPMPTPAPAPAAPAANMTPAPAAIEQV